MKELFLVVWMTCMLEGNGVGYLVCHKPIKEYFTSSISDATAKAIEHKDDGVRVFRMNHERTCNKELCFNTMSLNSTELYLKELPRFELKEKR